MTITKKQGREALARAIGAWLPAVTTSNGNAGGTTVIAARFIGEQKDAYKGYFLLLTSGAITSSGVTPLFCRVTAFDGTTGAFTVTPAFGAPTQVISGITFELHAFSPELFTEALNRARAVSWPHIFKALYDSSITLTAGDWEYTMPTGILPEMISLVEMEGSSELVGIPDSRYVRKDVTYSQDGSKIWLNRGQGVKTVDVTTGKKLFLMGRNYLTVFAKDTTYGALVTDTTAAAELTENTPAWTLFMEFAAWQLYLLLASGPLVQNRKELLALAEAREKTAWSLVPRMRMLEPDWDSAASL